VVQDLPGLRPTPLSFDYAQDRRFGVLRETWQVYGARYLGALMKNGSGSMISP